MFNIDFNWLTLNTFSFNWQIFGGYERKFNHINNKWRLIEIIDEAPAEYSKLYTGIIINNSFI
jgi:hypothetical protein